MKIAGVNLNPTGDEVKSWEQNKKNMDISRIYFCCCSSKFLFLDLIL